MTESEKYIKKNKNQFLGHANLVDMEKTVSENIRGIIFADLKESRVLERLCQQNNQILSFHANNVQQKREIMMAVFNVYL